jgi:MHS family proline/betaine transporter-like MFS transporter
MGSNNNQTYLNPYLQRRRAVAATIIGNGLEWFDFTVYSLFSVVIAKVFFPSASEVTSYLLAVATFGAGFMMRPVGGIMLGIFADKRGPKAALSLTILLMALGTIIIAVTPAYAQIGVTAPVLVVFARLLQGFSAGGEMGSATGFLSAYAPPGKKAYYLSWIQASCGIAIILGSGLGVALTTWLTPVELESWGWRVPFIIGSLIGPVGFYIRHRISESPSEHGMERSKTPLREVVGLYRSECLTVFMLVILWTVSLYTVLFYLPSYSTRVLGLPTWVGFMAGMVGGLVSLIATPMVGAHVDRIGARPWLLGSALAMGVMSYPMFLMINQAPGIISLLIFEIIMGLLMAGYVGGILFAFSELLPKHVISTGLSIAYNCAVMTFGGFATFIVTWLISITGTPLAPSFYIIFASVIGALGAWRYRPREIENLTIESRSLS